MEKPNYEVVGSEFPSSEIRARVYHSDMYDPYMWIALVYEDCVIFRSEIIGVMLGISDNVIKAADPKFFKKFEQALDHYIDI